MHTKRLKNGNLITTILFNTLVIGFLFIQIYPIVWLFVASLKPGLELVSQPFALPDSITLDNYRRVLSKSNIWIYMKNSMVVTGQALILIVFLSAWAGFAISKYRFKVNRLILSFFTMGIMIPIQVTLIPLFIFYSKMNILNTSISLILPQVGFALPISIMLFVSFFKFIPDEIIEAAIVDGANDLIIFFGLMLPLIRNTVITVLSMYSIFIWNDFIFANTFISDSARKTVSIGLQDYIGAYGNIDWGATFGAICISLIPPFAVYFLLNKWVIAGMTAGAAKG